MCAKALVWFPIFAGRMYTAVQALGREGEKEKGRHSADMMLESKVL